MMQSYRKNDTKQVQNSIQANKRNVTNCGADLNHKSKCKQNSRHIFRVRFLSERAQRFSLVIRKTEAFVPHVWHRLESSIFNRSLGQLILSTTDTMQVGSTALEMFHWWFVDLILYISIFFYIYLYVYLYFYIDLMWYYSLKMIQCFISAILFNEENISKCLRSPILKRAK